MIFLIAEEFSEFDEMKGHTFVYDYGHVGVDRSVQLGHKVRLEKNQRSIVNYKNYFLTTKGGKKHDKFYEIHPSLFRGNHFKIYQFRVVHTENIGLLVILDNTAIFIRHSTKGQDMFLF